MFAWLPLSCLLAIALSPLAAAQADRFELALRLRNLESQLADSQDGPARQQAMRELDAAVQAFFRFNLPAVASAVDRAALALAGRTAEPTELLARSLQFDLPVRLVTAGATKVEARLSRTYTAKAMVDPAAPLRLEVRLEAGEGLLAKTAIGELPLTLQCDASLLPPGDHALEWSVWSGDQRILRRTTSLSVADQLETRLQELGEAATAARVAVKEQPSLEGHTLVWLHSMLSGMRGSPREETVLPGHRLLLEAERLAAASRAGKPRYADHEPGQFWLQVPVGSKTTYLRLQVPAAPADGKPTRVPLVLALHGAGGSENMFFDGYGDGLVARLAAERGWFVAAPRLGMLGGPNLPALVDALASRWNINPDKVFVVGHSMGAAQTIASVAQAPSRFAAVAALGGGGNLPQRTELGDLPFLVGVGSLDFARPQALALHQRLRSLNAKVTLREYADIEHLAIVQFALPEVFNLFDGVAGR